MSGLAHATGWLPPCRVWQLQLEAMVHSSGTSRGSRIRGELEVGEAAYADFSSSIVIVIGT